MSARSILALTHTVELLETEYAVDCTEILARHGLNKQQLDPNGEIGRDRELQIFNDLLAPLNQPTIGLEMGRRFGFAGYGPLAMLLMSCETAYQGFQFGIRYQALTYLYGELALTLGEQHTALTFHPIMLPPAIRRILIDRDMVGTFKLINDIQMQLGFNMFPQEVWMPYPRPPQAQIAEYEAYFQCPTLYDKPYAQALISNDDLATRNPAFSEMAQKMYQAQCDAQLSQRQPPSGSLAARVASYLALFAHQFPTAEQVAAAFGIAERSFRRQLSQEKTPFQKISDDVKEQKARRYLADSEKSVADIAALLGYSESAAFVRAFERWAGITPAKYRRTNSK